jgi:signal peptidase II
VVLLVAGIIVGLDQWTKALVRDAIPFGQYTIPFERLGLYFVFEHVGNYGAAFGILQNQRALLITIATVVSLGILYYAVRSLPPNQLLMRILLGGIMGGAIGNVIDRVNLGYVTDFVKVGIPGVYYWPNFNIADSSIVVSVITLAVILIWQDIQLHRQQSQARRFSDPAASSGEG